MTFFNIKNTKAIAVFSAVVFFVSCNNQITETTEGLIDNSILERDTIVANPVLNTLIISEESSPRYNSNRLSSYLLGEYNSPIFGDLKASFVGQVVSDKASYPITRTTSETPEAVISSLRSVVLELPLILNQVEGSALDFELTNAIGDFDTEYDMKVTTFTTFLEELNADGSVRNYYFNGSYEGGSSEEELGVETVLYDSTSNTDTVFTFKETYGASEESIVLSLDTDYFRENFLEKLDDNKIENIDDLKKLFKGIRVVVEKKSGEGLLVPLNLLDAKLTISYANLPENTGEQDIVLGFTRPVFGNSGMELRKELIRSVYNVLERTEAIQQEDTKEYIQGTVGAELEVDISDFVAQNSAKAIERKWLVNEAKLKVYVDDSFNEQSLSNLFAYTVNEEGNSVPLTDYTFFTGDTVGGVVQYEDVENKKNPFVEFFITNTIQNALESGDITKIRIKSRETGELSFVDTRSTNARGLVLLNGKGEGQEDKVPQLEVIYSEVSF